MVNRISTFTSGPGPAGALLKLVMGLVLLVVPHSLLAQQGPVVITDPATNVSANSASLNGRVDPNDLETTVEFQYFPVGNQEQMQSSTAGQSPVTGTDTVDVSAFVSGLEPSTEYEFHVVAANDVGTTRGDTLSFTTETPPEATTDPPTQITESTAQLNGTVDPNGLETSVSFIYRESGVEEGFTVTAEQSPLTGESEQTVSAQVSELTAGTEYVVTVRAQNDAAFVQGEDRTFVTDAIPEVTTGEATEVSGTSATLNGTVDPNGAETSVVFEYGLSGSEQRQTIEADQSPLVGTEGQSVSVTVDGLEPDRQYTFQVLAENNVGASSGDNQTFSTGTAPPEAVTGDATDVTSSNAQLNGSVNPNGAQTTVVFEYGLSGQSGQLQTVEADQSPLVGTTEQSVTTGVGGLEPGREYTFRVLAENNVGTDTGSDRTFTTAAAPPEATTGDATEVTATTAQFSGTVGPNGAETSVVFEYYPTAQPESSATVVATESPLTGNSAQSVTAGVEGLEPGTDYTFEVLAENSAGSGEGGESTFVTDVAPPTATTEAVTEVTDASVRLNGSVDPNGLETSVEFEYHPTAQPESSATVVATESPLSGNATQSVNAVIEGLDPGTEYAFQVRAENSEGATQGAERSFTTEVIPPEVTTNSATDVRMSSAQLHGAVVPNGVETTVRFEWYPTLQPGRTQTMQAAESPLTGAEEQSVSAGVEGLEPGTEYSFVAVATNDGGTTRGFERSFETQSLEVSLDRSPEMPEPGTAIEVTVSVTEGFEPSEAQLFYRQGGETDYQSQPLEASGASTYVGSVPGTAVTARGVEFYVRLSQGSFTTTIPETSPAEQPLFVPVRATTLSSEVELGAERYQMVSVPARLDTADIGALFRDDFGPNTQGNWRLLRWNPDGQQSGCGGGQYEEFPFDAGSADAEIGLGQAYWLITREGGTFDVEGARSVETDPVTLTLAPGWSQVANPFPYPVAWSGVAGRGALQNGSPFEYESGGQNGGSYVPNASILEPWAGYWVCNPEDSPIEITIPPQEASSSPTVARTSAVTTEAESLFERELEYAIHLRATLREEDGSVQEDVQNVVGVTSDATEGVGIEDIIEPPPVRESLRLSIIEDSTRLVGSLRPEGSDGYTWDFTLSAPVPSSEEEARTVLMRLEMHGTLPPNFEHRLVDRDTGRRIPISGGSFPLQFTGRHPDRHLRLIVGTETFAEAESEVIQPSQTTLRAVYPNPSRGNVTVDYQVKTAQRVRISIYDMLGRRVQTLVDERRPVGHHTVHWRGEAVASGAYVVRMKTESTSISRRISLVR